MEQRPCLVAPCACLRLSEAARVAYGVTRAKLDEFLMYEFKVRRCEKARRRDPRRFPHHGMPCPEFRQSGACRRGPRCEFAHGVFEFWLHPKRYRTRICISGPACARKICVFAPSADELRPEAVSPAGNAAREATSSEAAKRAEEPDIRWVYDLVD